MSTNFFWTDEGLAIARTLAADEQARRPLGDERHIGKRWAAGRYCEACASWLAEAERCPQCGDGGRPCCGFTWAQEPEIVGGVCRHAPFAELIVDEYERPVMCCLFVNSLGVSVRRHVMDLLGVSNWC